MTTISSLARNTYTMYRMASGASSAGSASASDQSSKTASDSTAASGSTDRYSAAADNISALSNLVQAFSGAHSTSRKNTAQENLTNLWSAYTSSTSSSSGLMNLSAISDLRTSSAALVNSYNEAKSTFRTQYSSVMNDLKQSAQTVSGMNYSFSSGDIRTESDGSTTYSDSLKQAIANVKELVSDYNDALDLTSGYSSIGKRMSRLSSEFSDTTYRADVYAKAGIQVDSKTGALSVQEDTLAKALVENGSRVQNALGSSGLAGKAENHADFAIRQQDRVFPSMKNMFGKQLATASAYTDPRVLHASVRASLIGNLLNMTL